MERTKWWDQSSHPRRCQKCSTQEYGNLQSTLLWRRARRIQTRRSRRVDHKHFDSWAVFHESFHERFRWEICCIQYELYQIQKASGDSPTDAWKSSDGRTPKPQTCSHQLSPMVIRKGCQQKRAWPTGSLPGAERGSVSRRARWIWKPEANPTQHHWTRATGIKRNWWKESGEDHRASSTSHEKHRWGERQVNSLPW